MKITGKYALIFAVFLGLLSTETIAHGPHADRGNSTVEQNEPHTHHKKLQDSCRNYHDLMGDPDWKKGEPGRDHMKHKSNDRTDGIDTDPTKTINSTKSAIDSIASPQLLNNKSAGDGYIDLESNTSNKTKSSIHRPQSALSTFVPTVTVITTETVYAIETPAPVQSPINDGDTSNGSVPGIGSMFNGTHDAPADSTTSSNSNTELDNVAEGSSSRIDPTNTVVALVAAGMLICHFF
ncbi:hypothetical protein J3Q64DRAFT_1842090 [Phycomyces blakesleeanus]|uniref:Uncharacterized protein n=2 Tax=Phycomyces blakesleeanus TaxID=4837 RepID=A0A167LAN6_PHYB8|nr:hypothetical protein PHYBLDRAFT_149161 [Phycomyces blakesleeanus NRRL 1555(-)]OAD69998.1 hypothetical protein PHYBLDRAFT_149161 [Phycomyces blakesleeanus NRRL 1555(-)]|eukprot:XP_018288038.1 hypothetical protein PHYBLDRAFT_149161 [Phycomyces blakesleeanus NRRL 1555(-)]